MAGVIVAAVSENNVIGYRGKLPWSRIPQDMQHFRDLTMGHKVVMGRRTFYSIGKPLKGRTNIVLTKDGELEQEGIITCHSIEEVLDLVVPYNELISDSHRLAGEVSNSGPVYFIGGTNLWKQVLEKGLISRIEMTVVHERFQGDTFFPETNWNKWHETSRRYFPRQGEIPGFSFVSYQRV